MLGDFHSKKIVSQVSFASYLDYKRAQQIYPCPRKGNFPKRKIILERDVIRTLYPLPEACILGLCFQHRNYQVFHVTGLSQR